MDQPRYDFAITYDGLFHRGLGKQLTPRVKDRLREAGLDLDRKLEPAYPAELWAVVVTIAAEELFPDLSLTAATRQMGERFFMGYIETLLGKAVLAVLRAIGPMRSLARMQKNFRAGNNYVETRLIEKGPLEAELWVSETHGFPEFTAGIVEAGGRQIGARGITVRVIETDGHASTLLVRWEAG